MHRDGVEVAQEAFMESEKMVSPENMDTHAMVPSSSYLKTRHLYSAPGYYPSYFIAELYRIPLISTLVNLFGSAFTPHTGPFLTEHIMVGNRTPMAERIACATGVTDPLLNAILYFNESYAALARKH